MSDDTPPADTPDKPVKPDVGWVGTRFRDSSRYGFYMRYENSKRQDASLFTIDDERFVVLDVNPQQVSMREPVATSITFTQGGGKVRESRGGLIKAISISGTTGYTPLPQGASTLHGGNAQTPTVAGRPTRGSLLPQPPLTLDNDLAKRSGFLAFHRLRHLFRLYAWNLRQGATDVTLNYIDTKNDEYWRVEPQEFVMSRSSRKPFSYDYNISLQVLEVSTSGLKGNDLLAALGLDGANQSIINTGVKQSINRLNEMSGSGTDFLKHLAGATERAFQSALRNVNNVVGYFENIHDAFTTVLATPLVLLAQLDNTLAGVAATASALNQDVATLVSAGRSVFNNQNQLTGELNEWYLEAQHLSDFLKSSVRSVIRSATNLDMVRENRKFSVGQAKQGTATALMQPSAASTGSPDNNPFLTMSGLGLVTKIAALAKTQSVQVVVVNQGDTIFSLAQRLLGDINRFIDLVLLNNLASPYIVSDKTNKPDGTIAWGEYIQIPQAVTGSVVNPTPPPAQFPTITSTVTTTGLFTELIDDSGLQNDLPGWIPDQWQGYTITLTHLGIQYQRVVISNTDDTLVINIPWTLLPSVGDSYTLQLIEFNLHRPTTPDVQTFGSDVLLVFQPANGSTSSSTTADIVVSASRDVGVIRGFNNFLQAVNIRLHVELGRLPVHQDFGVEIPVGRPWSNDLGLLYQFRVRGSLLQDRRVSKVANMKLSLLRDQFSFSADVQPVGIKNFQPVSVTLP